MKFDLFVYAYLLCFQQSQDHFLFNTDNQSWLLQNFVSSPPYKISTNVNKLPEILVTILCYAMTFPS